MSGNHEHEQGFGYIAPKEANPDVEGNIKLIVDKVVIKEVGLNILVEEESGICYRAVTASISLKGDDKIYTIYVYVPEDTRKKTLLGSGSDVLRLTPSERDKMLSSVAEQFRQTLPRKPSGK